MDKFRLIPNHHDTCRVKVGAIIVAAGSGNRMNGIDKVFKTVRGHPILAYTIEVFEHSPLIDQIVIVLSSENLDAGRKLVVDRGWKKIISVCVGGGRRQDSVKLGLDNISDCQWVIVHDGVRPCIKPDMIMRCLETTEMYEASVAAVPVKDTIKLVSSTINSEYLEIQSTPPRSKLWIAQTPQLFRYELLWEVHRDGRNTFTDDAAMVEALGKKVGIFMGSYDNIKVTTRGDLALLEYFLDSTDYSNE